MEINLILSDDWIKASNEFSEYARQITRYGFYKGVNTKQQEQQGSDKQRSIPFKDSSKVSQGAGHTALLSEPKGSDILQDKAVYISGERVEILSFDEYRQAIKTGYSLR